MMAGRGGYCLLFGWFVDKLRRVRRRASLTLFLLCTLTVAVVFYRMILQDGEVGFGANIGVMPVNLARPVGEPKPIGRKKSHGESYSLLTQDPRHVEKQKQVKAHLLANINKMAEGAIRDDNSGKKVGLYDGIKHLQAPDIQKYPSGRRDVLSASSTSAVPVYVHLDLKGAAPKVSYLAKIFPVLRNLGVNGLVVEYEDMFPYSGLLEGVSAKDAYSVPDILKIQELAAQNQFEFVPLIQTFGHLEFVLKLEKFAHLREVPEYPLAICPSHNETLPLMKEMVNQILELHPDIHYLHIGSDEVYQIGQCSRCTSRMQADHSEDPLGNLFLSHVAAVAKYVRNRHVVPLMWDDHLRTLTEEAIRNVALAEYVQIVVWKYDSDVLGAIPPEIWDKYARVFEGAWVASAFKGAEASNEILPNVVTRMENHRVWRQTIEMNHQRLNIHGAIATGWQRYDHFAALCELLPVGMISLALSIGELLNISDITGKTIKALTCEPYESLAVDLSTLQDPLVCAYPGADLFIGVQKLAQLHLHFQGILGRSGVKGWMTAWQAKNGYSSPFQVKAATSDLEDLVMAMEKLKVDLQNALSEIYNPSTVTEWMETHFEPVHTRILELWDRRKRLIERTSWERRPISPDVVAIP